MDAIDWIAFARRLLHMVCVIFAAGGTFYLRFVLVPAAGQLPADARATLMQALRGKWSIPLHASIAILLVTGLLNYIARVRAFEMPSLYHMLFGAKFLLALVLFFVAIALSGRSGLAERMRGQLQGWLSLNVALVVILLVLSGLMRQIEGPPKPPKGETPVSRFDAREAIHFAATGTGDYS